MLLRISLLTALAVQTAAQAISAAKTTANINVLTTMSQDIDNKAKTITLLNGFQTGPEVIQGYHQFVKQATKDYNEMTGGNQKRDAQPMHPHWYEPRDSKYTAAQQAEVCSAFASFIKVNNAQLATVIGKHGILEVTGVAYQMAAVLRGVEGVVDEIAFTLIAEVPDCATKATAEKKTLDASLQKAIDTYAGGLP